jgi:hypothetical protein
MSTAFPDVKPWPGQNVPAAAGSQMGHNKPPMDVMAREEFDEALAKFPIEGGSTLKQRVANLLDSATRAKADDDESAGRCATLIKQLKAVETAIDGVHDTVKRPYLDSCSAITNAKKVVLGKLPTELARVRGIADTYMRAKLAREQAEQRRQEQERAQLRITAEQAAAAELAKAADQNRAPDPEIMEAPVTVAAKEVAAAPTQVRSEFGGMASMAKKKIGVIVDWKKAFNAVKDDAGVREAIQKAVDARVRAKITTIAGVEIKDDATLRVR